MIYDRDRDPLGTENRKTIETLREALRWALENRAIPDMTHWNHRPERLDVVFKGLGCGCCAQILDVPDHLRPVLAEAGLPGLQRKWDESVPISGDAQ